MKVLRSILILVLLALMVLPAIPVLAISQPDSQPQINQATAFDLPNGGMGVLLDYTIDYAVLPTETATEAYMAVFIDTDGTTQLKAVAPYTFTNSGYGRGAIWIEFTEAEVTAYSLDSADVALYTIWLIGNPTLTWDTGALPKTIVNIDNWYSVNPTATAALMYARIINLANTLELLWTLDIVESTALGQRLTTLGADYFLNVIPDLRTYSPNVFSSVSINPDVPSIDYNTEFGATAENITGTIVGSPVTLVSGNNTINVTGAGTILITLEQGTTGNITNNSGTLSASPQNLAMGENTLTVTGAGTFDIDVNLVNTQTAIDDSVDGTALDLTLPATTYGFSRDVFSGLVWFVLSILITVGAVNAVNKRNQITQSNGKMAFAVFSLCMVIGSVIGLMPLLMTVIYFVAILLFVIYNMTWKKA